MTYVMTNTLSNLQTATDQETAYRNRPLQLR
jgi:hypothetical protein